jgi:predicted glycosyltransferase
MNIVVDINHPVDVHFFKHFIRTMQDRGHSILITVTQKEVTCQLLEKYGFDYTLLGSYGRSLVQKIVNLPIIDYKMYATVKNFHPDLFMGFGSIRAAHVAFLKGKPCINFEDTEHSQGQNALYQPFVSTICTPSCFQRDLGAKQIRFNGYKELAYLHPSRFTPNPAVLREIDLAPDDPYIIIRFVAWEASHDIGQHGIRDKVGFVNALEPYGHVLISSERPLPPEIDQYRICLSPEKLHDLLFYARLCIGEGGTIASEAAVLGTPSIYISSLSGTLGYLAELEIHYHLLHSYSDGEAAITKALEILKNRNSKADWYRKREYLLEDKIDVTSFMVWFVEKYPQSIQEMQLPHSVQHEFQ